MNLKTSNGIIIERNKSLPIDKRNHKKSNKNIRRKYFFLTQDKNLKIKSENKKMKIIHNLMRMPTKKDPFDGFAIKSKKFNVNELIDKVSSKDNAVKYEKNKMCRKPYPLLTCLSNRNFRNNSNKFITDILKKHNKFLYKNFHTNVPNNNNKTYQNFRLNKIPIINKKLESSKIKENNINFFDHYIQNTIINKNNYKNRYNILFTQSQIENNKDKSFYVNQSIIDYNNESKKNDKSDKNVSTIESDISFKKYLGNNIIRKRKTKTVNLTYHNATTNYLNIINKRKRKINNLSGYSKDFEYKKYFDSIIKYISKPTISKNLNLANNVDFNSI
jgi:hypothetical protein